MKTIIAGGRNISNASIVSKAIADSGFTISEVVSGGCRGVDLLGERWGRASGLPITTFSAQWSTHGKAAGPIRNRQMAEYADGLIAIWDGESRGTANMINTAKELGLSVYIHLI